jgi:V8-like Glu-specific endopeptidase
MGMHRRPRRRRVTVASLAWLSLLIAAVAGIGAVAASGGDRPRAAAGGKSSATTGTRAAPTRAPVVTGSPAQSPSASPSASTESARLSDQSAAFAGMPTVGALFKTSGGKPTSHFCTASVVHSPGRDLILTAAHCVGGSSRSGGLGIVFVPGYHDGKAPYGTWKATRFIADDAWNSAGDPDHDVGFLEVSEDGGDRKIEDVTGAVKVSVGHPESGTATVVGYPAETDRPISCVNRITAHSSRQMEFDCAGFTGGTSGGPFFATDGSVIGVIGGYQQGGNDPDVSYSPTFTGDVQDLYGAAAS